MIEPQKTFVDSSGCGVTLVTFFNSCGPSTAVLVVFSLHYRCDIAKCLSQLFMQAFNYLFFLTVEASGYAECE